MVEIGREGESVRLDTRRTLGAFYTPADLAALVANWALDRPNLRILEPSVGSGSLLDAIAARTVTLGGGDVVGYEIDADTANQLTRFAIQPRIQVRIADFFDVEGRSDFDVVIANPPFTRNHQLKSDMRRKLKLRPEALGVVRGAPGLWVYFLLASLRHLKVGGRMVFVLPGAVEFADYADRVLKHLCGAFETVELISMDDAILWEGEAQERASVLIAGGYRAGSAPTVLRRRATTRGLVPYPFHADRLLPTADHVVLGAIAKVEIGTVTGANDTFLLSRDQLTAAAINSSEVTPAIARARHVRGITITADEVVQLASAGERTLLLTPEALGSRGSGIRNHLAKIGHRRRLDTVWLNKRNPWWCVQLGRQADAVLTYMNHFGPRLALIEQGVAATNTLHKVVFDSRDPAIHRAAAISMLTTYTQVHAEMVGRVYGGGVLKFELKDARKLPLLMPDQELSAAIFARVDTAMKAGAIDTARMLADDAILPIFFGTGWKDVQGELMSRLSGARALRNSRARKG